MSEETAAAEGEGGTVTSIDRGKADVTPISKASQTGRAKAAGAAKAPKASKASKAAKSTKATKKAPATKKASGDGPPRAKSTISKEGEKVDEFDGKKYPVTKFPTVKDKDGNYVRGPVTRANLEAWRAKKKEERVAKKASADAAKKAAASTKAAAKNV